MHREQKAFTKLCKNLRRRKTAPKETQRPFAFGALETLRAMRDKLWVLKNFQNQQKGITKSPLGIIALFIVLVYGFASLVVAFGNNLTDHVAPLIYFMVCFPVIVFGGFLWLVSKHHNKLYGPSDFKDEENFLKTQISSAVSLVGCFKTT